MKHLRVHALMPLDVHLLVLAFLVGVQLAIIMRAREALAHADDQVAELADVATAAVDDAERFANDAAERAAAAERRRFTVDGDGGAEVEQPATPSEP